ncbi:uncharacterized protein LOC142320059 [Lycorma delicatula]|uniref:uncharacterized protein LOC142320059 n=1 Tax=Lycorma delicatula TaxID=130591 RepID=UPI003F516971
MGHSSSQCNRPDRTGRCYNCSGQSHKKRDCTKSSRCLKCNKAGIGLTEDRLMKLMQLNANRSAFVHDLENGHIEEKIDFLMILKPNMRTVAANTWEADRNADTAILNVSGRYAQIGVSRHNGFVAVELTEHMLISAYISPNSGMATFSEFIEFEEFIRGHRKPIILTGDLNFECCELDGISTRRGYAMPSMFAAVRLVACNMDCVHTYIGRGHGSIVDIMMDKKV